MIAGIPALLRVVGFGFVGAVAEAITGVVVGTLAGAWTVRRERPGGGQGSVPEVDGPTGRGSPAEPSAAPDPARDRGSGSS